MKISQEETPLFSALKNYVHTNVLPFHVPGHKQGRGVPEFTSFVGPNVMGIDLTCMEDLDNICNPRGAIRQAEELAAAAWGADHAHFLVNGTTSGIQAMIMSVCSPGDEIILPRNAHKSATGGLILSGARPVYIEPDIDDYFGIAMGVSVERVTQALQQHPQAKAVFVINPTYYGVASPLADIVRLAHAYGAAVIVDEAHGAHLHFHAELPASASQAGADLIATSVHKLAGSMTQSSLLLVNEGRVDPKKVKAVLNLTQSTSPSYVLLASLDVARKQMALRGREMVDKAVDLARWVRSQLAEVPGLVLLDEAILNDSGCFGFDPTKIVANFRELGLSGHEVERLMRNHFRVQAELSDLYNALYLITIGDDHEMVETLEQGLKAIAAERERFNVVKYPAYLPSLPEQVLSPKEAFYSETRLVPLAEAEGEVSAEMIMAYPPGIPLICPGERLSREVIDYIEILRGERLSLQGTEDPTVTNVKVVKRYPALIRPRIDLAQIS
ncbi:MAG: aminotransferase class I/II-fold pyridoxal phosphate-dependent enzyme [Firmicutes bacterium]|nr:aminotransferase class I/II-fold pyridoxal phosphate-dependent enzyme [Bacillota bacterium]